MPQNEYVTVKEISLKYDMSARNVRRLISKLTENCSEATLYKDKNHFAEAVAKTPVKS